MGLSVNIIKGVWGTQSGYVFIPRRKDKKWDEGKAYKYPEEWETIKKQVFTSAKNGWDTYWCPLVFDKPVRIKENVKPKQAILWADLDFVDPTKLDTLRPSIAWKSSNERYQCLWALNKEDDTFKIESVNRDLTYHIGADKGGWDITQVLRVPGSPNYKYDPPQQGKVLWIEKRLFSIDKVSEAIKHETKAEVDDTIESLIEGWKISTRALDLLFTDVMEVEVGERSDRLWEIETSLLEAGLPILTIVKIVSLCPWNKFKGRRNEMEQIYNEVLKADDYVKSKSKPSSSGLLLTDPDAVTLKEQLWAIPFSKFLEKRIDTPEWLVEGIWQKGTYGMIAGEPKTYKSVQATDLALSVASGRAFLNQYPVKTRGAVLYIQEENGEGTVQDRINKVAASKGLLTSTPYGWSLPEDLPFFVSNNYGVNLTDKDHRTLIERTIQKINPVLVILDPLYMMFGGVDENSSTEVGDILRWLTYLRNSYKCSVLICHHYNKGGTNARGGQRIRGSSAFHAWVESALYVKVTDELYTVKIEREFRAFPSMPEIEVKFELGDPGELYYNPIIKNMDATPEIKLMKEEEVLTLLATSPRTTAEIISVTKISRVQLNKIMAKLVSDDVVIKDSTGKQVEYRLTRGRYEVLEDV